MRALIVCDGNTCRSPTLQLLLGYLANRLGCLDEFVSAGRTSKAGDGDQMPLAGQWALSTGAQSIDQYLDFGLRGIQRPDLLEELRRKASAHRSQRLDDIRLRGPFDKVLFIVARRSDSLTNMELFRAFEDEFNRLDVPPFAEWQRVMQGDRAFYERQRAKNDRGVADPDRDPRVIQAYIDQAVSLAKAAMRFYSIPPKKRTC